MTRGAITHRLFSWLINLMTVKFTMPHYISPPNECLLAEICNHTWVQECGKAKTQMEYVIFSDNCHRHEYNCDNNKDYGQVELSECKTSTTNDSTTTTTTTSLTTLPPTECSIADACNHTWIPECGKEKTQLDIQLFSDECSRHEYNCDNKKDYSRVEMSECEATTTTTTTSTETTTTIETTTPSTTTTTTTTPATTTTTTTTPTTTTTTTNTASTTTTPTTTPTTTTPTTTTTTTTSMPTTTTTAAPTTTTSTTSTTTPTTTTTTTEPTSTTIPTPVIRNCTRSPKAVTSGQCSSSSVATTTVYTEPTTTTQVSTTNEATTTTTTEASTTTNTPTETTEEDTEEATTITEFVPLSNTTIATTETTEQITDVNENTIPHNADTTKAVANVTCTNKGCEIIHTWETTAKGETRDFYQILRERYGTRVKLLRATTHWPRRVPWSNVQSSSFVFGRHVDSANDNLV